MNQNEPAIQELLYLDQSKLAQAIREGEAALQDFTCSDPPPGYPQKLIDILKSLAVDSRKANHFAKTANGLAGVISGNPVGSTDETGWLKIAESMIGLIVDRWKEGYTPSSLKASIKILTTPDDQSLGIYQLEVELVPLTGSEAGIFFPDLGSVGATEFQPDWWMGMQTAWGASGLSSRFQGIWRVKNVSEQERVESTTECPKLLAGDSATAAALLALLAASGDPYCEGTEASHGEVIEPTVAISATVTDERVELEEGPTHPETNEIADVLKRKLGNVEFKSDKLSGAFRFGLSTVYFSETQVEKFEAETDATSKSIQNIRTSQKSPEHDGLVVLEVDNVLAALDGVLQTSRQLRQYQEDIGKAWLKPWKEGTADFETMKLAGEPLEQSSETPPSDNE